MRKASQKPSRRGDGQWLAWAASGLIVTILSPAFFDLAAGIYAVFLEDELWRYEYAAFLVYPIFGLCAATGFFGFALFFRFAPRLGLLALIKRLVP